MDIHHAWCDWKPGVSDLAFSEGATKYLSHWGAKEWMAGGSHVGSPFWLFWATSSGAPPKRK